MCQNFIPCKAPNVYIQCCIYPSFNGLLVFFHLLSVLNNDVMNIAPQVLFSILLGLHLEVELPSLVAVCILTFFGSFYPFYLFFIEVRAYNII